MKLDDIYWDWNVLTGSKSIITMTMNMFGVEKKEVKKGVDKFRITNNGTPISYRDWIDQITESTEFISFYISILRNNPYEGYYWEVKPVTQNKLEQDFEFVLVESEILPQILADDRDFKQYFTEGEEVVSFPNLGGDAQLIVPTQRSDSSNYGHLAAFVRQAPLDQNMTFWKKVGEEYGKAIGKETTWLSTAGLGVAWLHVRIDSRPKYYRFDDYKSIV